jgi:sulfur-carrier protein
MIVLSFGLVVWRGYQQVMSKVGISITVKLFAAYQEAYKVSELVLDFPENTQVFEVRERLINEHPELARWRDVTRFGVNLNFVEPDTIIQDGDEVVLIPPVSGG